ncbi:MAG TPA: DUF2878 domain-containing protein [bacterium]|nr:DUF2878 domain-containing protein [bacterium]
MSRHEAVLAAPGPWRVALNVASYQAGWTACVLGVAYARPWLGVAVALPLLALHFARFSGSRGQPPGALRRELALVVTVTALGFALDTAQAALGVFRFAEAGAAAWVCPPWLVAIWALFGTTLNTSLHWLRRRYALAALLGALGGPLAYGAGWRLGAVNLGWPPAWALGELALVWAVVVPALVWLAARPLAAAPPARQFSAARGQA